MTVINVHLVNIDDYKILDSDECRLCFPRIMCSDDQSQCWEFTSTGGLSMRRCVSCPYSYLPIDWKLPGLEQLPLSYCYSLAFGVISDDIKPFIFLP